MKRKDKFQLLLGGATLLVLVCVPLIQLVAMVGGMRADLATLKSDVGQLKLDVGQLQSDVSQLQSDVSQLKSDVGQLKSRMDRMEEQNASMQVDIAVLKQLHQPSGIPVLFGQVEDREVLERAFVAATSKPASSAWDTAEIRSNLVAAMSADHDAAARALLSVAQDGGSIQQVLFDR